MTPREKVILGLTATAAVGAGLYYAVTLSGPAAASPVPVRSDFTALIAEVQVGLQRGS